MVLKGNFAIMRIDKFLWSVRLFKTRTQAAEACKSGRIEVDGATAKAAMEIKKGQNIRMRDTGIHRTFCVLDFPKGRLGAALVAQYLKETTPEEELQKRFNILHSPGGNREKGTGRPTKKDRRELDRFTGESE